MIKLERQEHEEYDGDDEEEISNVGVCIEKVLSIPTHNVICMLKTKTKYLQSFNYYSFEATTTARIALSSK